ncbi:pyridoxal phosphate-dependent transferase [Fusarium oxysporum Fo47]|uniref:2,2-dialkylglycine decarboxylase (Pyruvate) n=1 Tax=Fusarium oxysporum Fo47 TaxID=660027 RepID=W9JE42_FUSOX|nr:pyridoxal phosphate-dependent transferase [Fusarium oxysporum Fo47]EWZ30312.1 2,2-dialkylglycine decarboxylase (pyruvate) [Fusarium oxysporum Fo47]QKD59107.1 pyridoxal phosphate-dependent transferase [Fusarium oxysporum Fo47]
MSSNNQDSNHEFRSLYPALDEDELARKSNAYLGNIGVSYRKELIVRSEGRSIWTASGHKFLDWTSGQMSCLLGHGHPEIVKVVAEHAAKLDHLFTGMLSPPVIALAERLCNMLPPGLDRAFFLSTGGESNEAAIKLAKVFTGKFEIVGLGASWHGMTAQALGVQYRYGRKGHGPNMPGMFALPAPNSYRSIFRNNDGSHDWEKEMIRGWSMIDMQSCGSLAACIVECIQSSAGIHALPPGYLKALKRECDKRGMLLIVDEAQTGIGRSGDLMAIMHEGVVPDIVTLSKTLGNGLPLSAVVTSTEINDLCTKRGYCMYTTHANDPLPCAVGDKVFEIVMRDNLVENVRALGNILHAGLRNLQSKYKCIGDVRGRGLMAGVEIVSNRETKAADVELGQQIAENAFRRGLWANLSSDSYFSGTLRMAPSITSTEEEILEGLRILDEAFATTPGTQGLSA